MKSSEKDTILERRSEEVIIDKKYEINRNKLAFKTDENGEFRAAYILTHRLRRKEKRVFYAMLEERNFRHRVFHLMIQWYSPSAK
ncbi:hypothetical protein ABES80_11630 [Bacillus gobiensis]